MLAGVITLAVLAALTGVVVRWCPRGSRPAPDEKIDRLLLDRPGDKFWAELRDYCLSFLGLLLGFAKKLLHPGI